jgi:hypothetical protein
MATGKLDPTLAAMIRGPRAGASDSLVIIRITLTNAPKDALAQLKNAGFAIGSKRGNEVSGRIAVEKLETLAKLPFVAHIAPQ